MEKKTVEYVSKTGKLVQLTHLGNGIAQMSVEGKVVREGQITQYGNIVGVVLEGKPILMKVIAI